jgi:hypothetical protein
MYSLVLLTAMSTATAAPAWARRGADDCLCPTYAPYAAPGCYAPPGAFGCYGSYDCYAPYACHAPYACTGIPPVDDVPFPRLRARRLREKGGDCPDGNCPPGAGF